MTTRKSGRPRNLDHSRPLRIIRTYQEYAQFETASIDANRIGNNFNTIATRVEELKYESSKTLETLKNKQPVRIPETHASEGAEPAMKKRKAFPGTSDSLRGRDTTKAAPQAGVQKARQFCPVRAQTRRRPGPCLRLRGHPDRHSRLL